MVYFLRVTLSAIVPTHDRPAVLRRCLETLQAQDVDRSEFEVVVVDDGSRSDITAVVGAVAAAGPIPMRCERQPMTGLNAARNRGVAAATGHVLGFLDDDTLVAQDGRGRCCGHSRARPARPSGGESS